MDSAAVEPSDCFDFCIVTDTRIEDSLENLSVHKWRGEDCELKFCVWSFLCSVSPAMRCCHPPRWPLHLQQRSLIGREMFSGLSIADHSSREKIDTDRRETVREREREKRKEKRNREKLTGRCFTAGRHRALTSGCLC